MSATVCVGDYNIKQLRSLTYFLYLPCVKENKSYRDYFWLAFILNTENPGSDLLYWECKTLRFQLFVR